MYNCRMPNTRKGFTLLETIVTIGIIGLVATMTGVGISSLASLQNGASEHVAIQQDLESADNFIKKYVSTVDVNTSARQFLYQSTDLNSVRFNVSGTDVSGTDNYYLLSFENNSLTTSFFKNNSLTTDGTGFENKTLSVPNIRSVTFTYESSIALLVASISAKSEVSYRYAYPLRAML